MAPDPRRVAIRVVPRASRNSIDGVRDGRLIVRVTAPPADGAATAAAVWVLADALGVPRTTIQVVSGQTSRNKAVTIGGLSMADVFSRLAIGLDRTAGSTERCQRDPRSIDSDRRRNR
jgi:uncharacterized protein (TIGR00251 family)